MLEDFFSLVDKFGLKCNERFLLLAASMCHAHDAGFTVEQLSERFSVSPYLVTSGLGSLVRAGLVSALVTTHPDGARPFNLYRVEPEVCDSIGGEFWDGQGELIKLLLLGGLILGGAARRDSSVIRTGAYKCPPTRTKSENMLPSMRLILVILVAFSDSLGRVSGDEFRSLRRLCALSVSRLRGHIRDASDLGVVSVVPGVSSRWFRPAKRHSIFFLDLDALGAPRHPCRLSLHFEAESDRFRAILREKELLLAYRFISELRVAEVPVLMCSLLDSASILLCSSWKQLDSPEAFYASLALDHGVADMVSAFLVSSECADDIAGWTPAMLVALHDELARFVLEVACMAKRWLSVPGLGELKFNRVQITPFVFEQGAYWACIRALAPSHGVVSRLFLTAPF